MTPPSASVDPLLQHIFDALPSMVFIVDTHLRVQAFNAVASELLADKEGDLLERPGGEALGCLNASANPAGCGHGQACAECVVRNCVEEAFAGRRAVRRRTRLELSIGGRTLELFALVTASHLVFEGRQLVLLVIEDFSEIAALRRMIPICCVCKKIREDAACDSMETADAGSTTGWSRLETYFKTQWGVDFSHGCCPDCYRKAFGEVGSALSKNRVA
jgi:hypothetical protein